MEVNTPIAVRFTRNLLPYIEGEVAWFNEQMAASYVRQSFAEVVQPQPLYVPAPSRGARLL